MLLQCCATKGIEQDFQGGVSADFMQGFTFVLEDFFACHVFGVQDTALGRAMHVFDQIPRQGACQQGFLLFDKGTGSRVGQVLDGLAAQDRQLASLRVPGPQLASSSDATCSKHLESL